MNQIKNDSDEVPISIGKIREPTKEDGKKVWQLIKNICVLDLNSSYQYLLWCSYFDETSAVVEKEGEIVGFVSGFIKPKSPDTLFIWQVAVDESVRGKGLATKMIQYLLEKDTCKKVSYIEATVTPSNIPSQQLFHGLARKLDTKIDVYECFTAKDFPEKGHEDEQVHLVGPF